MAAIEFPVEGLTGDGIWIRLITDADAPVIAEACRDPAIQRFTTVPDRYDIADAEEFRRHSDQSRSTGLGLTAVIADTRADGVLGTIGVRRHATDTRRWDIGYWIAPWARGRGLAVRAVRLISRWGFEELGAERLEICAEPENEPSQRVAERAGFTREGLLRSYMVVKGVRRDMLMYSLLRGELP